MLVIELSEIPPQGRDVDEALDVSSLHLEDERDFTLEAGGRLACHLALSGEGLVQVNGRLVARLGLTCGRCLEPFALALDVPLELVYVPQSTVAGAGDEDEVALSDRDMIVAYYEGERLDLGEMVREQLLLSLSLKRLCREDCRGLCPVCGTNWNVAECACARGEAEAPLGPLGKALESQGSSADAVPIPRTRVRA
jgi:uncharacterized protein